MPPAIHKPPNSDPGVRFTAALKAWGTPGFRTQTAREIERLGAERLPLQQGLSKAGYALNQSIQAMILEVREESTHIHVKAGVFYSGVIAGCSCADDPTPVEPLNEYCEIALRIDKQSAETTLVLMS